MNFCFLETSGGQHVQEERETLLVSYHCEVAAHIIQLYSRKKWAIVGQYVGCSGQGWIFLLVHPWVVLIFSSNSKLANKRISQNVCMYVCNYYFKQLAKSGSILHFMRVTYLYCIIKFICCRLWLHPFCAVCSPTWLIDQQHKQNWCRVTCFCSVFAWVAFVCLLPEELPSLPRCNANQIQ